MKILSVKNLHKHFVQAPKFWDRFGKKANTERRILAVNDVSFDLYENEILGILGQSGSGKTTLIRTIMRLAEPTSGQAIFKDIDIFRLDQKEVLDRIRPKMRMIFQHPDAILNPAYTVEKILAQALELYPNGRDLDIVSLLSQVRLSGDYGKKYPHELSGGEKRRIAICRALATQPEIIFADEPVSGLDVTLQMQVLKLFHSIQARKKIAFVFISHDINTIHSFCQRIAVMFAGRIVEIGLKNKLSEDNCKHPYTRLLFASRFDFSGKKPKLDQKSCSDQQEEDFHLGCAYLAFCPLYCDKGKPSICKESVPELKTLELGHEVACHFGESL